MIFTVIDAVVAANPALKLFVRDSYTYFNRENGNTEVPIYIQETARYNYMVL